MLPNANYVCFVMPKCRSYRQRNKIHCEHYFKNYTEHTSNANIAILNTIYLAPVTVSNSSHCRNAKLIKTLFSLTYRQISIFARLILRPTTVKLAATKPPKFCKPESPNQRGNLHKSCCS